MDLTTFYSKLREINRAFKSVEEHLGELLEVIDFGDLRVRGIGIVVGSIPKRLDLQLSRRFEKRGKIFFFDALVRDLEKYRDYVAFFVDEAHIGSSSIDITKHFGVLYAEFQKHPKNLKQRFPAWEVVRGSIKVGRKEYRLKGVMRIPTYDRYTALFIAHPEDVEREIIPQGSRKDVIKEIIFPLQEIIERYRYSPTRNRITTSHILTTPLFK